MLPFFRQKSNLRYIFPSSIINYLNHSQTNSQWPLFLELPWTWNSDSVLRPDLWKARSETSLDDNFHPHRIVEESFPSQIHKNPQQRMPSFWTLNMKICNYIGYLPIWHPEGFSHTKLSLRIALPGLISRGNIWRILYIVCI